MDLSPHQTSLLVDTSTINSVAAEVPSKKIQVEAQDPISKKPMKELSIRAGVDPEETVRQDAPGGQVQGEWD